MSMSQSFELKLIFLKKCDWDLEKIEFSIRNKKSILKFEKYETELIALQDIIDCKKRHVCNKKI